MTRPEPEEDGTGFGESPRGDAPSVTAGSFPPRRILKWTRWGAGAVGLLMGGVLALVGSVLLVLQLGWGSTSLARLVAGIVSSDRLLVEVEGVEGSWVRSLSATGLRVAFSPDGGTGGWVVEADTAKLSYRLLPLLRRKVQVEGMKVMGIRAQVRLAERDSLAPEDPPDRRGEDAGWLPGGWELTVGALELDATEVEVWEAEENGRPAPEGVDLAEPEEDAQPWTAAGVRMRLRDLQVGSTLAVVLEVLAGSFRPPGAPQEWGRVGVAGRVESESVFLDSLVIESPESRVRVRGTAPLAMRGLAPDGVDVHLFAEPLHMRDLGPLLPPGVSDSIRLYARGDARTTGGILRVEVDADSRGAGRLQVEGEAGGEAEDAAVRGRVRLEGVDLLAWGITTERFSLDAGLEADLAADLAGVRATARGSAGAEATLRHGGRDLEVRGRVLARADSGAGPWRAEWSVASTGVEAAGTGTVDLGDPLASTLEGRFSYDSHAGAPPIPGADIPAIRGHFRWESRGSSLDSLMARAELRIDTAAVNLTSVEGLVMVAQARRGQASFLVEGAVAGGRISAEGGMDLLELSGRLQEARLDGVDLAALLGDPVPSVVSATASGSLGSLSPLRASASLRVHSSEYGGVKVDSALVIAELRGGVTDLRLEAAFPDSGQVRLAGRFDSSGESARVQVDSLHFAHLDLRMLMGGDGATEVPATDLTGSGVASLASTPRGWDGGASLELAPSRVGVQAVEAGLFTAELAGSGADLTVDVRLPGGGLTGEARLEGLDSLLSVVVPEARFQAVDVGAFLGREDQDLLLSGRLEGRLQGTRLDELVGSALLVLEDSRVFAVPVEAATLEARMAGGQMEGTVAGRVAGGDVRAEATADLAGARAGTLEGRLWAEVDSVSWGDVRLDEGRLRLTAADGILHLDTLSLRSPDGFLLGDGRLPMEAAGGADGEITFRGELMGADILATVLGAELAAVGSAVLDGTITGALDDLRMEATANVSSVLLDDLRVQGIELRVDALRTEADGFTQGSGTLRVDELNLSSLPFRRVDVEATLEPGEDLEVTASAVMDDDRAGSLSARVELAPDPLAVLLDRFEFRAGQDEWALARPARIDLSNGIEIDSLSLVSADQEILARGRVGTQGPLDLRVDLRGFRVETVADMVGFPFLRGSLSGVLALDGTAESPLLDATFSGRLEPTGASAADLTLAAEFADGTMELEGVLATEGDQGARIDATLPLDFSLASGYGGLKDGEPILLEASADSLSLEWVGLFVPSDIARDLQGVVDGTVRIEGNPESPRFAGSLDLNRASARIPALGLEYRRGEARIRLQGDQILVDSIRVRSGGGSLRAHGAITLPRLDQPEFAVTVMADGFHAIRASGVDATASGELELTGTGSRLALAGSMELDRSEIQLGDMVTVPGVRTVTLSEDDYRELAQVFGYRRPSESGPPSDLFDLLSLDVDVRLRRDSWIRQRARPEMAVQFAGEVSVRKEPGESIRLLGTVESVPGRSYVEQFGRRFSIASGTLQFRGTPAASLVDLRAEYAVPSRDDADASPVVVALNITGTPEDLRLELSSTPVLEPSDMVSYIVMGRPAGETLGAGEGGSLTDAGEAFALGRLTGAVEAYAREQVGLDVVEITADGLKGMTLVAGRYVSPSLYLGIRQPLSLQRSSGDASERTPDPELEVELEALRWLLLNLRADGRSGVELFVRTRISYD